MKRFFMKGMVLGNVMVFGWGFLGAADSIEQWKTRLNLTDEQANKLQEASKAHQEALRPLADQAKEALETLNQQVRTQAKEDDIKATLDQVVHLQKSIQEEKDKFMQTTESFLTPSQRAKMILETLARKHR